MILISHGQQLVLLPDRALYWPARKTLLIADPHFGKASVFRISGIFIPSGTTNVNLSRLDALLESTGAERIVFLGDFLHGPVADNAKFVDALVAWRATHPATAMHLMVGNHDRFVEELARRLQLICSDDVVDGPFVFKHHPEPDPRGYVLCGHLHPSIELRDRDGTWLRMRCFWFQKSLGVLPSFGEFTGSYFIEPTAGDAVYGIGKDQVVPLLTGR